MSATAESFQAVPDTVPVAFVLCAKGQVTECAPMAWNELAELLGTVTEGPKDGRAWVPAAINPGPRKGERVQSVTALVLDIEADAVCESDGGKRVTGPEPPPLKELAAELVLLGWRAILHTSHSHTPEHSRYRAVFAVSRPLNKAEVRTLGLHVASVLGIADAVDTGCLEPARLYYLPRAPRERLGAFEHRTIEGPPIDVDALLREATRARDALQAAQRRKAPPRSGSVIEAFNAAHDVGEVLEAHGYIPKGRNRWLFPGSTSRMPGVRLLPESAPSRIYSSHAGDPLNNGRALDAFDVFRILGNDGDMTAAVREAARLLGMDRLPEPPQVLDHEPGADEATDAGPSGFVLVPVDDLERAGVPAPEYIIPPYLPTGVVTLLGAHGGTGKSFLSLILAACVATGRDFMGMPVQRVRVVVYSAEDGKQILRWRLRKICRALGIDPCELSGWLVVLDVTDTDPALYKEARDSGVLLGITTAAYDSLSRWARDTGARLVIIDNASDTYEAGENDRARVRGFVRSLAQLARRIDGPILLLAHIDKHTAKAGKGTEGYSGSTAWHNSVRSRLFLSDDEGVLTLEHQKANLGPRAEPLSLAWDDGMIVPVQRATGRHASAALTEQADAEAVLHALLAAAESGANVPTGRSGPATTWHFLKSFPDLTTALRERTGKERFWHALTRLQRAGKIRREQYRNEDRKQRSRWVICASSSAPSSPEAAE